MVAQRRYHVFEFIFAIAKRFLLWSLTLTVYLFVASGPILLSILAASYLCNILFPHFSPPNSAFSLVSFAIRLEFFLITVGAAIFSLKGLYPRDVSWLRGGLSQRQYACPLTGEQEPGN